MTDLRLRGIAILGAALLSVTTSIGFAAQATKPAKSDKDITVKVTDTGFEPAQITVKKDTPVHLVFLRTSETTCGTEVLIPDQKIQKSLPLNKPVAVDLTFKQAGEVSFTCGQKMLKGSIVVQAS